MKPVLPLTKEDIVGTSVYTPSQASVPSFSQPDGASRRRASLKSLPTQRLKIPYLKRLLNFQSLDFETALWEMINLLIRPKRVYKSLYYQTHTKNKWSRDDPSFVLVLSFFLVVSAVFWGIVYAHSFLGIIQLVIYMVVVDFWIVGGIVATISWYITRTFLLIDSSSSHLLEWAYCFDIHCNAYLIIWFALYFVQFFILPILRMNNYLSALLGNLLYLGALSYYSLITFYGFNALPFLHRTEYLLAPILAFGLIFIIFTVTGFNIANYFTEGYSN